MRLLLALLLLAACDGERQGITPAPTDPRDPLAWTIGPIARGENRSVGMPLHPTAHPEGWSFDFPRRGAHVHYVTFNHGPLTGKTQIRMRYRVEMEDGVSIRPQSCREGFDSPDGTCPDGIPAMLTLYFQRRGDNWLADRDHEAHRWYATFASVYPITAGERELVVALDGDWTGTIRSTRAGNPEGFRAAIDNAESVGFVLGGGDGTGHGVYADGEARFVLLEYRVE